MSETHVFGGMTIKLATPEELNSAAVFGKRIEVPGCRAYSYKGDIWVDDIEPIRRGVDVLRRGDTQS